VSGWDVDEFLSSLHWLFKDTPARRDDYCKAVGKLQPVIPKFLQKWMDRKYTCRRKIFDVKKHVAAIGVNSIVNPKTKSFEVVKQCTNDQHIMSKMSFYLSAAKMVAPFLKLYQTDKPMLPFLALFR